MAQHKEFNFRTLLVKMFSPKMIRSAAKHTGAVVRDRKISIVDLFWTLVSGFGAGKERTIRGCVRIIPLPPSQPTHRNRLGVIIVKCQEIQISVAPLFLHLIRRDLYAVFGQSV
jgi:hypothetical protein